MQIWKRARQDTWERVKRHVGITIIVSGLGLPAGFFILESERAMDELHIFLVYKIKGHWTSTFANNVTRIKRKELQRYFKGRDDYPVFLRDPGS